MSSIEGLKEKARRHEQKEEWQKALDLYLQAIEKLAEEEQPDIGLYNRVGDLFTRTGQDDQAVEHYEQAVELYLESELPNNAIAVCKKILRNLPGRHAAFLRMGQIRAGQGFLVDARQNFLTYAERVQEDGDLDEAMRALVEFAELAPEDTDIRMAIAGQFEQHGRTDEAVEQLIAGHQVLAARGDSDEAKVFEAKIEELDPSALQRLGGGSEPDDHSFSGFGEVDLGGASRKETPDESAVGADFAEISLGDDDGSDTGSDAVEEAQEDAAGDDDLVMADFGSFDLSEPEQGDDDEAMTETAGSDAGGFGFGDEEDGDEEEEDASGGDPEKDAAAAELEAMAASFGAFGAGADDEVDEDEDIGGELPIMSFDDDEDIGGELPGFGDGDDDDADEDAADDEDAAAPVADFDLPGFDDDDEDEDAEDDLALPGFDDEDDEPAPAAAALESAVEEAAAETREVPAPEPEPVPEPEPADEAPARAEPAASRTPREEYDELAARAAPDDVQLRQRMVELAHRIGEDAVVGEAYLGLAKALRGAGNEAKAQAMFQQVLTVDPENAAARSALGEAETKSRTVPEVAASEDYVDLGSLILGDDEEKTTRFVVAYEEPSGDEDADFKKMLSQFKAKVAENFDASDVKGHHDLGTAYKEMGLLDEAVEEFQQALRASANHLPTYELLGQVFLEKGENEAAARVLTRALDADWEIEDELLGIYYYLGRAHESLGKSEQAVHYYDQVFSLDINFADVTERLRKLR